MADLKRNPSKPEDLKPPSVRPQKGAITLPLRYINMIKEGACFLPRWSHPGPEARRRMAETGSHVHQRGAWLHWLTYFLAHPATILRAWELVKKSV